jgi:hypothetical protein
MAEKAFFLEHATNLVEAGRSPLFTTVGRHGRRPSSGQDGEKRIVNSGGLSPLSTS